MHFTLLTEVANFKKVCPSTKKRMNTFNTSHYILKARLLLRRYNLFNYSKI